MSIGNNPSSFLVHQKPCSAKYSLSIFSKWSFDLGSYFNGISEGLFEIILIVAPCRGGR